MIITTNSETPSIYGNVNILLKLVNDSNEPFLKIILYKSISISTKICLQPIYYSNYLTFDSISNYIRHKIKARRPLSIFIKEITVLSVGNFLLSKISPHQIISKGRGKCDYIKENRCLVPL